MCYSDSDIFVDIFTIYLLLIGIYIIIDSLQKKAKFSLSLAYGGSIICSILIPVFEGILNIPNTLVSTISIYICPVIAILFSLYFLNDSNNISHMPLHRLFQLFDNNIDNIVSIYPFLLVGIFVFIFNIILLFAFHISIPLLIYCAAVMIIVNIMSPIE
jgi:hypothetical protein